jgi:dienelactone hydrolase
MNPLVLRKLTTWLSLALFAVGALAPDRPGGLSAAGPVRTSGESSPFLKAFLSFHNVTVVSRPVHWVSALGRRQGLLVRDDSDERLPALLLIERGPASEFAKRSAHELAGIGYVVLLVELDPGRTGDSNTQQTTGGDVAQRERALAQLSAAVRWLRRRDDVLPDRMAALGWNAASRWAVEAAAATGVQAAVLVDPPLPLAVDAELAAGLRHTAVLVVRGTAGASLLEGEFLARLKRELDAAGITHDVLEFDKAETGFMGDGQADALDAGPADRAWFEIYEYLAEHVEEAALNKLLAGRDSPNDGQTPHRFSSVADLMRALNTSSGVRAALAKSLADEPQSEKDWQQARARAALMADAGELLLELKPPKGVSSVWRRHAASFRDSASAIAVAADRRDYSAAQQAINQLNVSCGKCHIDHR